MLNISGESLQTLELVANEKNKYRKAFKLKPLSPEETVEILIGNYYRNYQKQQSNKNQATLNISQEAFELLESIVINENKFQQKIGVAWTPEEFVEYLIESYRQRARGAVKI